MFYKVQAFFINYFVHLLTFYRSGRRVHPREPGGATRAAENAEIAENCRNCRKLQRSPRKFVTLILV